MKAQSRIATPLSSSGSARNQRRAVATRDASLTSEGSSAPSRGRVSLFALAIVALGLLAFAPLTQAKVVVNGFGTSNSNSSVPSLGGEFHFGAPRGIAVNNTGNGGVSAGTVYAVDGSGNRIQRFSPSGAFQRLWGQDVIATAVNEQQRLRVSATGGTYTLTFNGFTTNPIAFDAQAFVIDDAIDGLPSIGGDANVEVSGFGGALVVTLQGALAATDQPQLTADTTSLTGTIAISTRADGTAATGGSGTGFEICTVATHCQAGVTTGTTANGGQLNNAQGVAVNQANGHVYVTESGNRRVSEFDADGNFIRAWGWDVIKTGGAGDVSTNDFETCTVAADCKQASTTTTAPANGADGGRFGSSVGYPVTDSSNNVWVPDPTNRRIQEFDPSGNFIAAYGYDVAEGGAAGTGTVTTGSTSVTSVVTTSKAFVVGQAITGTGIPAGTKITAIGAGTITLSQAADGTAIGAGTALSVAADAGNVSGNEQQTVTLGANTTGGTFTLTFTTPNPSNTTATTAAIAWNAPPTGVGSVQEALENLANVGVGNVSVTGSGGAGGVYTITFQGTRFADTNVTQMTSSAAGLTVSSGSKTATVATTREGGALEKCTSASAGACKAGTSGSGAGQFGSGNPTRLALDSSGNVYATDTTNARVQKFDSAFTTASNFGTGTFPTYTTQAPENVISTQGGTRLVFSVNKNVSGAERQILEIDPTDASVKDTSLAGSALSNVSGLAADSASGTIYATTNSFNSPRSVLVLNNAPPAPGLAMNFVTSKTDTTADFSGTVDPNGGLVSCKFQYSTDQAIWTDIAEPGCDSFASDGIQGVDEKAFNLKPNTQYFVRLSVTRPLVPNSTTITGVRSFTTDAPPPVLSDVGAIQVGDTLARMVGTIDPRNSDTGYVFEYGTTPALGSSTAPVNIGGGTTPIVVSRVVGGLTPDTTYYFRLSATNGTGTTQSATQTLHTRAVPFPPASPGSCPNEAVRQEQSSTFLPACRAYEMVSPIDKNQGGTDQHFWKRWVSNYARNGEAAAFCTNALFGEPTAENALFCATYISRRTGEGPTGWETADPFPRYCHNDRDTVMNATSGNYLSPNMDFALNVLPESSDCPIQPIDPAAPDPAYNYYRQDLTGGAPAFQLLAPNAVKDNEASGALYTDDFSHVVYVSNSNQTPDSPPPGTFKKLYDWEQQGHGSCTEPGGCLNLVSKDPSNTPFTTNSQFFSAAADAAQSDPNISAISETGDRIYFKNGSGASQEVYMRENDAVTHDVSETECTSSCGSNNTDTFLWADPSGEIALIRSCAKLTNASSVASACPNGVGGSIYRWDLNKPPTNQLTDLTVDHEPNDGTNADSLGVLGASTDGEVVYFVTSSQIVSGASTSHDKYLYRSEWNGGNPTVEYLAPYFSLRDSGEPISSDILDHDPNGDGRHQRVTPDGKYLLLTSLVRLDPVADQDADSDAYRWSEEDGWQCVSCQLPGVPSAGHVNPVTIDTQKYEELKSFEPKAEITDDGQRIVFMTMDALVPEDINGESGCPFVREANNFGKAYSCMDIYEWHDGTVSLVTSGAGPNFFVMMGITRDGQNIFFQTRERMVGWDGDTSTDLYVARTDGGFPEPPIEPPPCEGEACRGAATTAPNTPGAGTAVFQGPGDPTRSPTKARRCPKGKRKVTRNGKVRCVAKKPRKRDANGNRRDAR